MTRQLLSSGKGKGPLPLGSKAGNVSGAFAGGSHMDKGGTRKVGATGGNHANPCEQLGGRNKLNFSNKDGQRQAGNAKLSNATKGPSGRSRKSKGISGK